MMRPPGPRGPGSPAAAPTPVPVPAAPAVPEPEPEPVAAVHEAAEPAAVGEEGPESEAIAVADEPAPEEIAEPEPEEVAEPASEEVAEAEELPEPEPEAEELPEPAAEQPDAEDVAQPEAEEPDATDEVAPDVPEEEDDAPAPAVPPTPITRARAVPAVYTAGPRPEPVPSPDADESIRLRAASVGVPSPISEAARLRPAVARPPADFVALTVPRTQEVQLPSSTGEVREFIRLAAAMRGVDPDIAIRVALSEGGLTPATWTGDHGSSFGPYQLHYAGMAGGANAVSGLGDAFTTETGLRADDPSTWRQQVEWSLDRVARGGWTPWHGAAAAGIQPFEGVGQLGPRQHVDVPNQFAASLSPSEAYAACGPVAAVAVARFLGRNPTVAEALERAKLTGWTAAGGMNGIYNELRLLDAMHIPAHIETPVNWRHVQQEASSGNPVIISTPGHYWVIDDFDPRNGAYHVGRSGLAYRGGAEWMTADQMQQMAGQANGALYIDHPLVPGPSVVASPPSTELRSDRWWEDASPRVLISPRQSEIRQVQVERDDGGRSWA
jgi:hypothetical protein